MSQPNSSTSSSEPSARPAMGSRWLRDLVVIGGFMIATLATADVAINVLFPPPDIDGKTNSATRSYFEYGRSIEGKLARIVGASDETAAKIAHAGWLSHPPAKLPKRPKPGPDLLIATYGMSHSNQLASALADSEPTVKIRSFSGPAAAPSCAYAYYLADRGRHDADVVMLGILASRVAAMESTSGMNCGFEAPCPYTYPKFIPNQSGGVETIEPAIRSLAELRSALNVPARRTELIDDMRRYDSYYASYLFDRSVFDHSALARMVRRAFAHRHDRFVESLTYTDAGFRENSATVRALNVIVRQFAASARSDGKLPVVLLIDSRGYSGHLFEALGDVLERDDIPFISTNTICSANDPTHYVPDGHFTAECNRKFARALAELIAARLSGRWKPTNSLTSE